MTGPTIGVIVAAGSSSRMGEPKALLPIHDRPMLQWVVDAAEESSLEEVVVVTGADEDRIRAGVRLRRARWAHNPQPERGTMSSLRAGLAAAGPAETVVKLVSDQPEIRGPVIDGLLMAWDSALHDVGLVAYAEGDGHPVVVSHAALGELGEGDRMLWRLIEERPDRVLRLTSNQLRPLDVNGPEDYEAVVGRLSGRS